MSLHVVGIGLNPDNLPEEHTLVVDEAQLLVGSKRMLAHYEDHPADKLELGCPPDDALKEAARRDDAGDSVVFLVRGDPLFYGVGKRLVDEFGPEGVRFLPNITIVQAAAARVKVPWQDIATVNLHGSQDFQPLFASLMSHDWVAVLTDAQYLPSSIAQALLDRGAGAADDAFVLWVFEDLESEQERFDRFSLHDAAQKSFSSLNLVLVERKKHPARQLMLGAPDEAYESVREGVTPAPVRAAIIAALRLAPDHILWDLGAGSGAVAIEASSIVRRGRVTVVERNADKVAAIRENVRRFGALTVDIVHGSVTRDMPSAEAEPGPQRIFMGSGMALKPENLEVAGERLAPGGRMVVQCVRLDALANARDYFEAQGFPYGVTMMHVDTAEEHPGSCPLSCSGPVFLVAADKPEA